MNGFLARLVTETRGESRAGIRPNLPTRFAPSPAARGPVPAAIEIDAETVAGPARPVPRRVDRDGSSPPPEWPRPRVREEHEGLHGAPEPPPDRAPSFPESTVDRDRIETTPRPRPPAVVGVRAAAIWGEDVALTPESRPTSRHEPGAVGRPHHPPQEIAEERDAEAERPGDAPPPSTPPRRRAVHTQGTDPEVAPAIENERRPPPMPVLAGERLHPTAPTFEADAESFQAPEAARPEPRAVLRAYLADRALGRDEQDAPARTESPRQAARGARSATANAPPPRSPRADAAEAPAEIEAAVETTVHVSIGRIEVRALAAPSAPPRAWPAKPAKSLDDYLHARARGAGR